MGRRDLHGWIPEARRRGFLKPNKRGVSFGAEAGHGSDCISLVERIAGTYDIHRSAGAVVNPLQDIDAIYTELRRLAAAQMANEPDGHTLQPTALVSEAWLRLASSPGSLDSTSDRSAFFRAAAVGMQRVLVDHARAKKADKRGGGRLRVDWDPDDLAEGSGERDVLAVHDALEEFRSVDPQCAELVTLRYFAGMSLQEAAETMGVSRSTADRWWFYARTWLYQKMRQS